MGFASLLTFQGVKYWLRINCVTSLQGFVMFRWLAKWHVHVWYIYIYMLSFKVLVDHLYVCFVKKEHKQWLCVCLSTLFNCYASQALPCCQMLHTRNIWALSGFGFVAEHFRLRSPRVVDITRTHPPTTTDKSTTAYVHVHAHAHQQRVCACVCVCVCVCV